MLSNHSEEKARLRIVYYVWWVESQWLIVELVQRNRGWSLTIMLASSAGAYLAQTATAWLKEVWTSPSLLELEYLQSAAGTVHEYQYL